ncbi:MAG: hypothetical protein LKE27_05905 [Atopobiaceae bacterium]|jgi:BirA family biotin operon repressor/biotin-[acetyl-CoA-carboxylase] ligase|nr:hypothetical protein [Atopobiaceae bacterium]
MEEMPLSGTGSFEEAQAKAEESGRAGAPAGTAFFAVAEEKGTSLLCVSVVLAPKIPMPYYESLPAVSALGVVEGLESAGAQGLSVGWPDTVVFEGATVGRVRAKAGYGDAGMFCAATVTLTAASADVSVPALEGAFGGALPRASALAEIVREALLAECRVWEEGLQSNGAGPMEPVLDRYFDRVHLMGETVDVVYPNGRVRAQGRFAGIDIWGRATVVLEDGSELEFAAAESQIRG